MPRCGGDGDPQLSATIDSVRARARDKRRGEAATSARLLLAATMQREGTALMRENLRRRHPQATSLEIDSLLERWLLDRPLDGPGREVPWPRSPRSGA